MKNIIFLTQLALWSMDDKKGAPSFYKTIEAYVNDGWNVTLISTDYGNNTNNKIEKVKHYTFRPIFKNLLNVKKIGALSRIAHSLYGNYMLYKFGKKALREYYYSAIVYAYEVHGVNAGKKLKREYDIPFITRFQGTVLANVQNNLKNRIKKYPHFQALYEKSDLVIMTNDGTRGEEVLKRLRNKTEKILFYRNGVDIKHSPELDPYKISERKIKLGLSTDDSILLTVSRLASWKRVDRAITALAEAIVQIPNCKLVIIGDGEEKNNLMKLSENLGISDNVIFKGAIMQTEVVKYMEAADIFLSLYDLSNLGNPLLEAMSCGKAIITLDVGDTNTVIQNEANGILLKLEEINKIPYYIIKIINDHVLRKQLGDNAKRYAQKEFWSWEERMKAEIDIVNELYNEFMKAKV